MKKRVFFSAVCLALALMTGCSSGGKASSQAKADSKDYVPYGKYKNPVTFTIGRSQRDMSYMLKGDTIKDNPETRFLEQQTNIKAKVAWESADFDQKLALSISTGDIPDVLVVNQDQFEELKENDLIANLSDVYKKCASDEVKNRMKSYNQDVIKLCEDDNGELKAIPQPYYYYEQTLTWYRKDWLDKVGAKVPETVDEMHDVAKKFVAAGLGGKTTYGFTLSEDVAGNFGGDSDAAPILNQYGAYPRQWIKNKDGKVVYGSIQPEMKEGLKTLRQWYKEGLIDKQFAVRSDDERTGLLRNSVGIQFGPWYSPQFEMGETIKNDPKAEWIASAGPKDENGKFQTYTGVPVVRYVVVRKGYKHPEAVMRAINCITDFNYSLTDEAKEFRAKSFKSNEYFPWYYAPIDVKLENSQANKNDYNDLKTAVETKDTSKLPDHLKTSYDLISGYLANKDRSQTKNWSEYACYFEGLKAATDSSTVYNDMAFYGKTKTMETKWANLQKLENETILKIVMNEASLDSFDDFVDQWNEQGGAQITKEVNAEVDK